MKRTIGYGIFLIALAGAWGCGQKGAKLQKSVVPPDKTLFENGSQYLEKSQYIKARLAFQTLINTYPDSEMAAESYLAIGDSFYDEGGTENLLQAEDQYKNFIIFFPTNPKAADAQMKIISLNVKMMRSPDRDQHYTEKAEAEIHRLFQEFPNSDYVPIARELLKKVQENLALRDFGVGEFYAGRKNYAGARSRFEDVVKNYPDFSRMDEVYWDLADALDKTERSDEAAVYLSKIASGYPFSQYFEQAKARLKEMGKDVPKVDTQLAAANEAKLRPSEPFSPLKPFVDFAKALGFKGPPDAYDQAQKTLEAQRAETAGAQAASAEQGQAGEDVLIKATLTKDASGKTQVNANGTSPSSDKNGDKKKDEKKKPEKPNKPNNPDTNHP